uniref:B1292H11.21 protein n=1 Tax=Oryza sativa subsp. japonica TaxID=39947 RepID=Q6MWB0_ORYSJ|nr:B1292H11.21 [Oryza sativa Japonica Group]
MSWHRAGVLLLGAQSCLPVPGVPAVGGIGSVLLSMARMGWKLCHIFRLYTVVRGGGLVGQPWLQGDRQLRHRRGPREAEGIKTISMESDARINIERRRDEGRLPAWGKAPPRLERRPPSPPCARRPAPTSLPSWTGCKAFVASLRNVRWPLKFRPNLTEKYDGSVNPSEFLQIYTTIIRAAGGDDRVKANYFPMALKGQARGWLITQPPTPSTPGRICASSLLRTSRAHALIRERRRICMLCSGRTTSPSAHTYSVSASGVRHNRMLEKIASKEPKTSAELFELADKVARKEEAWAWNSSGFGAAVVATPEPSSCSKQQDKRRKRKPAHSDDEGHVLATEGPSRAPRKEKAIDSKLSATTPGESRSADKWCSVHNTYRHSLADCRTVLADFIAKWTQADDSDLAPDSSLPEGGEDPNADIHIRHWVMHVDGSLNLQGVEAGVALTSPSGYVLKYIVRLDFGATNNMAEYEGLLAGRRAAAGMGICCLLFLGDSQLVMNQVSKEYQCTDPQMDAYVREVRCMERHFDGLELRHVPRRDNAFADELSRIASARAALPQGPLKKGSRSRRRTRTP